MSDLGGGWTIESLGSFFGWSVRTIDHDRIPVVLSGDQPEPRTLQPDVILEIGDGRYLVKDHDGRWHLGLGSEAGITCLGGGEAELDMAIWRT